MNRLKSSMLIVLAAIITASVAVIPAQPVEAQGSAALSISPRKNYTIEPGNEVNDTLLIRNIDSERALNLTLMVVDFTYNDDGGTPKLILDQDAEPTPWSLRSFIEAPESVTIEPGDSASLPVRVSIPENQGAGSYYSAIVYSSSASDGGNVGLSASGVSLVFVTVPGQVDESLRLEKLGAYDPDVENRDGSTGKFKLFNLEMPQHIGYRLANEGNVAESPVGSVTIKNILFNREVAINDVNPNSSLVLIGQTRTFDVCVKQTKEEVDFAGSREEATTCSEETGLWPGLHKIEFNGFYGWNGNTTREIVGSAWMLYTPWWFLAAMVVVFVFAGYYGRKAYLYVDSKLGRNKRRQTRGRR